MRRDAGKGELRFLACDMHSREGAKASAVQVPLVGRGICDQGRPHQAVIPCKAMCESNNSHAIAGGEHFEETRPQQWDSPATSAGMLIRPNGDHQLPLQLLRCYQGSERQGMSDRSRQTLSTEAIDLLGNSRGDEELIKGAR